MGGTLDSGGRKSSKTGLLTLAALLAAAVSALAGGNDPVAINPESQYPEGPVVAGDILYYAEMGGDRVMAWDGKENRTVWSREGCGPTSVARGGEGTLIVLCHLGNAVARIRSDGQTVEIIDRDADGKTFTDPNASINDARGGVYFSSSGSFDPKAPSTGAVLYLDAKGKLTRLAEGIHYSNGVALTPDGRTLYVSEHLSRRVLAYDVAADGSLAGKRVFVALDSIEKKQPQWGWEVGPDGLAVDHAGNLYIAEYGGGHVLIVDSRGKLIVTVPFREKYTTAMALADKDRRLFVTAPVSFYDPTAAGEVYEMKNPAFAGE